MKIDERKVAPGKKGQGKPSTTPKSRGLVGKNELKNLQSSLDKEVVGGRSRRRVLTLTF